MTIYQKQLAQENLLSAMQTAFDRLDQEEIDGAAKEDLRDAMSKQMARVEKLFGFEPNSFLRGC
jgi:hypothetical protein